MSYNNFQLKIFLRVILITGASFLTVYSFNNNLVSLSILSILLILIQTASLITYLNGMQKRLINFLQQIKEVEHDFSLPENKKNPFDELHHYFEKINSIIKNARIEKEHQYHYLQYVIEHIATGLIAFDKNGKVELVNNAAKKLLKTPALLNINTLDSIQPGFCKTLQDIHPMQQKELVANIDNKLLHLSIKASLFKMKGKEIKLVSFQDIKRELDAKELDSWQKLIRVLAHEISNSITPITTLTSTLSKFFKIGEKTKKVSELNQYYIEETLYGLHLIEDRGKGLIDFVQKYRSLTKNIEPEINELEINELFENLNRLFKEKFENQEITFTTSVQPGSLNLLADKKLIDQVLINLIKNAIEALQGCENKKIKIIAFEVEDGKHIQVIDNGPGIQKDDLDSVFIPFYTTKSEGSGIGLSFSRQIMRAHNGSLEVHSTHQKGTIFTLKF